MSLRLHLLMDRHGRGKHLFVYDGTKLLGEIAAAKVGLAVYSAGRSRASLEIEVPERYFTLEVDTGGRVVLLEDLQALQTTRSETLREADLVGYKYNYIAGPDSPLQVLVRITKDSAGRLAQTTVTLDEWNELARGVQEGS